MDLFGQMEIGDERFAAIEDASEIIADTIDKVATAVKPHHYVVYNSFFNKILDQYQEAIVNTYNDFLEQVNNPVLEVVERYKYGEEAASVVKQYIHKWSEKMEVARIKLCHKEMLLTDGKYPHLDDGTGDELYAHVSSLYNKLTNYYRIDQGNYRDEEEIISIVDDYAKGCIEKYCGITQEALVSMADANYKISEQARIAIRKSEDAKRFVINDSKHIKESIKESLYVRGKGLTPVAKFATSLVGLGAGATGLIATVGLGPAALLSAPFFLKLSKTSKNILGAGISLTDMREANLLKEAYKANPNKLDDIFEKIKSTRKERDNLKKRYDKLYIPVIPKFFDNTEVLSFAVAAYLSGTATMIKQDKDRDAQLTLSTSTNIISILGYGANVVSSMRSADVSSVIKNAGGFIGAGEKLFDNAITLSKSAHNYLCTRLGVKDFKFDQKEEELRHKGEIIRGHLARLGQRHNEYITKINSGTLRQPAKSVKNNEQGLFRIFGGAKVLRAASDVMKSIYDAKDIIVDVESLFAAGSA